MTLTPRPAVELGAELYRATRHVDLDAFEEILADDFAFADHRRLSNPPAYGRGDAGRLGTRQRRMTRQEKLWPQPQVRDALGFVMANPDWSRPSL